MVAMARALSFSRRRSQRTSEPSDAPSSDNDAPSEGGDECERPVKVEAAAPPSKLQQLIRSASFGRRGCKGKENSCKNEDSEKKRDAPPTPDESSSDSRPVTPDDDAMDGEKSKVEEQVSSRVVEISEAELDAAPMGETPRGWLMKRHQKQPHQWAKRFFVVNDERGTIGYSKGDRGKRLKPSVVLSLQDIKAVKLLRLPDAKNPILINCPPISLIVAADDREEARMWVIQLNKRMKVWRAKAAQKIPVAVAAKIPTPDAAVSPAKSSVSPREEKLEPRDATTTSDRLPQSRCSPRRDLHNHSESEPCKHPPPRALVQYPANVAQSILAAAPIPAAPHNNPSETKDDDGSAAACAEVFQAAERHAEQPGVRSSRHRLEDTSIEAIETLENDSETNSPMPGGWSPENQCLVDPWGAPTRNLTDLLSSDEEDEDAEDDNKTPDVEHKGPKAPSVVIPSYASPARASFPGDALLAEPEEPQQVDEPEQIAVSHDDWDSDEENPGPEAVDAEAAPQMVGDGIQADPNFIDEDWDSENE
ncbi:hypothetical protein AB1Y20_001016 [Prymnesium parvum]|uniref:PH domain-containing protein n=1 Tax=Prymnesium parvum TaxID=97485 RepID=A0AB34KC45_PRYPA